MTIREVIEGHSVSRNSGIYVVNVSRGGVGYPTEFELADFLFPSKQLLALHPFDVTVKMVFEGGDNIVNPPGRFGRRHL